MTDNTYIYNRFSGYTTEDCSCEWCLYVARGRRCTLDICCCIDERAEALDREHGATNGYTAHMEAESCRA